jgi:hypothetical protein
MPRNVLAHKGDEELALEYVLLVTASDGPPPTKLYSSRDIFDELFRRHGMKAETIIGEARGTLKMIGHE